MIISVESVSPDIDSPSPFDQRHSDLMSGGLSGFGETLHDRDHDNGDIDLNKILELVIEANLIYSIYLYTYVV